MKISLDKLEELAAKATPGPWNPFNGHQTFAVEKTIAGSKTNVVTWNGFDGNGLSNRQNKRNANFIAAANPDTIKSLIARVRNTEEQLKAAQEQEPILWHRSVPDGMGDNVRVIRTEKPDADDKNTWQPLYAAPVPAGSAKEWRGTNEYGLDMGYISGKLALLLRDLDRHTSDEAARVLARLAMVADSSVFGEEEFRTADHIPDTGKMVKHEQEFSDEEYACIRDAVDRLMSAVGNDVDGDQSECSLCSEFLDHLIKTVINPLGVKWVEGDDVCEYYSLGKPIRDHIAEAGKMTNTIEHRALEWMMSDDTGSSSEAISAHMLGLETEYASYPSDPAELGRCLRLLELIPEWKPRIKEMAIYGPGWAGQVEVWEDLYKTMEKEVGIDWSKGKKAPETYKAMKLAQANGYRNDPKYQCGFDKNGFVSWSTRNREEEGQ